MKILWTIEQAARHIGVLPDTLRRHIKAGHLKAEFTGVTLSRAEVLRFERTRTKPGRPKKGRGK